MAKALSVSVLQSVRNTASTAAVYGVVAVLSVALALVPAKDRSWWH